MNPNNDAQNDTEFFVFSSGTQADAVASPSNGEDFGWNAVWDSSVKIVDDGWIVSSQITWPSRPAPLLAILHGPNFCTNVCSPVGLFSGRGQFLQWPEEQSRSVGPETR